MKIGTINSAALASCWSALQISNCVGCDKYTPCTLPQRGRDPEYDRLLLLKTQYHINKLRVVAQLKYYKTNHTLEGFDEGKVK